MPTRTRPLTTWATLVLALVLGLTACSSGTPSSPSSAGSTPTPSSSPSASPSPAPVVDSCHALTFTGAARPQDDSAPVPCTSPHTAQTVRVGDLSTLTSGDVDVESGALRDQVARACPDRLLSVLGGDVETRRLSRFEIVWFTPTTEQAKAGAGWFRCDVVGLAAANQLIRLPAKVRGVLDRPGALDQFGTCGTRAPGKPGFQRVVCRRAHSWRAIATVAIDRSARYLGPRAAAQGDADCKDVAAAHSGGALRYTWSFEWPTRAQWTDGQRYGYCWVPA